jgi:fatty acid synthase, bacteria type
MTEHDVAQPVPAPAAPAVAAPAAAPAVGLGSGPPASFGQWDPGSRARYASALQAGAGNQYVARMATLARNGPPELGPGNLEIPAGIEQEYTVSAKLEELSARLARGEITLAEAEAEMAAAESGAAAAGEGAAGAAAQGGARAALQGVARALANISKSGPAMAGVFGAYVTIKATLATLEDAAEERRVGDQIVASTDGYVAGFMAGVGWSMQGGDAAWYADGLAKGTAAKDALVAKAKADPALQKCDIGPDEVLLQIRERREAFHSELYATVKPQVASLYLKKWRENLSWATKTFTNEEEGGERRIRTRAGMPDTGALPEPGMSPPPTP